MAGGCDVRGASRRIGERGCGLRQHQGAIAGSREAPRGAGDGGCGIIRNALQRFETRGEIGRGNDAPPFVVTAAPIMEAGVEAVRRRFTGVRAVARARGVAMRGAWRGGWRLLGRAPVRIAARETAPAVERIALTRGVWRRMTCLHHAETQQRIGREGKVAIGFRRGLPFERRCRLARRFAGDETDHAKAASARACGRLACEGAAGVAANVRRREDERGGEDETAHSAFDVHQPDVRAGAVFAAEPATAQRVAIEQVQQPADPLTRLASKHTQAGGHRRLSALVTVRIAIHARSLRRGAKGVGSCSQILQLQP